jgi:transcriptional regulator with GAF, ATPase, and Fis domain
MESKSSSMHNALILAKNYATRSTFPILILGETGTGKTHLASQIHTWTGRQGAFVVFDCSAVSASLIESELFGHVRGAFTGADRTHKGAFERADGGTLFLDEVGELPLELQPRLLRAVDEGVIRPVGGAEERKVNVQIISATNRDLHSEVTAGRFRSDLRYRIAGLDLTLPPLRQRLEDIPQLLDANGYHFCPSVIRILMTYSWPGNIRELLTVADKIKFFKFDAEGVRQLLNGKILKVCDFQPPSKAEMRRALILASLSQGATISDLKTTTGAGRSTLYTDLQHLIAKRLVELKRLGKHVVYVSNPSDSSKN